MLVSTPPALGRLASAGGALLAALFALNARFWAPGVAAEDPFFTFMRPRVGYFSRYEQASPYAHIYETYVENVLKNTDRSVAGLSTDDWRRVRPSGELCVDWLMGLTVKSYVMMKPYEVILLDACLDWLFNESHTLRESRQEDLERLDSSRKATVAALEKDPQLRRIYQSTQLKESSRLPAKLLEDIYNYVQRLLAVFNGNPRNGCHSQWLEAYNDFIDDVYVGDCEDESSCRFYGLQEGQEDSYLRMIAESTKEASKACYRVMQTQMRGLMDTEFENSNSGPTTLAKRLHKTQVSRQLERERWARELVSILQLASGIDQETRVNLGDVVVALEKIKSGDRETIGRFTSALSDYAMHNVDLKDSANDPSGRARFGKAMGKLCRPYTDLAKFLALTGGINTDEEDKERKPFEFYSLIYSLVRITNHETLLGVSKDQFEDEVIKNRWEALYLATFACQIISTTWGEFNYENNAGQFNVLLRPNSQAMYDDWPIEVLHQKLPIIYPRPGDSHRPHKDTSSGKAIFGKKFNLNFRSKSIKQDEGKTGAGQADVRAPSSGLASILGQQPKVAQQVVAPAAPSAPSAPSAGSLLQPARESAREAPIMSLETINMFREVHGRYPKLPANYKQIYPELPDDLSGEYPRKLGQPVPKPNPKPSPKPKADLNPKPRVVAPQILKRSSKPDYSRLLELKI